MTLTVDRPATVAACDVPPASPGRSRPASPVHRAVTALAAIGLLGPAFDVWGSIVNDPAVGAVAVVLSLAVMGLLVAGLVVRTARGLARVDLGILAVGLVALVGWALTAIRANPSYGTDEAAYIQYAASLWMHGVDPYGRSLLPALDKFGVPIQYATYTLSGGVSSALGYPAWTVLVTAPFVLLTGGVQSVVVADMVSALAGLVVVYLVLPRRWKGLAVITVVDLPILFGFVVSGDIAVFLLPLLGLVAWRWTKVGEGGRMGWRDWLAGAALGAAMSTNQLAWFLAVFVVAGILLCRVRELGWVPGLRVVGQYVMAAVAVFVAVNLPFIIEGPLRWAGGVLVPLTQHAIPYGQGLVDLPVFAGVGGGDLGLYTVGGLAVLAGLLAVFVMFFDRMWRAALVLPSVALWFPDRSLAEYWMPLVAVWAVATVAAGRPPAAGSKLPAVGSKLAGVGRFGRRFPVVACAVMFAPAVGLLTAAVTSPSPLSIRVVAVRTDGQLERVWKLTLRVSNRDGTDLTPHYATDSVGQPTSFWTVVAGPSRLGAGRTATVTIEAPNVGSMPGISNRFEVEAFTARPETVSTSPAFTAEPYTLSLDPTYFPAVRAGQPIRITVQLRSDLGADVHRAGVLVDLGQIVYGEDRLIPATGSINGRPEGQTPVGERTNRQGVATFVVVNSQTVSSPLYFQAWAIGPAGFPFGYSPIVSATWTAK